MQFNTYISSSADIQRCANIEHLTEVLIEPASLAREGRLTLPEAKALAKEAQAAGLKTVLVWDILMTEEDFGHCTETLRALEPSQFSAIRVQCLGAAQHIKEFYPHCKLQLIAETANCNLRTLLLWCTTLATQLERIILSIQLPAEKISQYVQNLPVPCEILGIGRILLFYSRRNLLKKNFGDLGESWREIIAASEDSHNRPFPVIDNQHGTFMYLDKDQFIVHKVTELGKGIPAFIRIDLRHLSEFPDSASAIQSVVAATLNEPEKLREEWPRPTIAPFFKSNLTTKQFKFLNSELRYSRDEHCLAEVVSTEREKHTVLRVVQPFELPGKFRAIDPSGTEITCEFNTVKTLSGELVTKTEIDQLVLAPWLRKISTGSLVVKS